MAAIAVPLLRRTRSRPARRNKNACIREGPPTRVAVQVHDTGRVMNPVVVPGLVTVVLALFQAVPDRARVALVLFRAVPGRVRVAPAVPEAEGKVVVANVEC